VKSNGDQSINRKRVVVTGGSGFVGKALCRALHRAGFDVLSISRRAVLDLEQEGICSYRCDLTGEGLPLTEVLVGAHAVFHTAAHVEMWGAYDDFFRANVVATRRLLDACERAGCPYFIFTSSPSVVAGDEDLRGVDESIPYPGRYRAWYPETKAVAEREVRLRGGKGVVKTISLRPHLIFGPGDTNLIPTILDRARKGRLPIIGRGTNLVDVSYIDDCVAAHLCALTALESDPSLSGEVFFISQGEPVGLWAFIDEVLSRAGIGRLTRRIDATIAFGVAAVVEGICRLLPTHPEPPLTTFLVKEMSTDHYFNISRACARLGYTPHFSVIRALEETFRGEFDRSA
jgi:nucleoside-diphosphate-sugar epimerase